MVDYIIGGGSAGCVLAARLSEQPAVQVVLLEAGGPDISVLIHCPAGLAVLAKNGHSNWAFQTEPQAGLGGRRGYQPRGMVLGGSSSVNAMIYARGHRADYDHWASLGNAGWGWDDVLPYFRRSEHNERGADAWHGSTGPLNVMDPGKRPNLQVLTGARSTRILMDGRRAVGVEFIKDGERRQLNAAREVLLCAGALQSPQLLMLSGIGPAAQLHGHGIPVVHDLPGVGGHLHDHIDVVQVWDAPRLKDLFGLSLEGATRIVKAVFEWRQHRSGMLTTNFAEAGGFIRSGPGEPIPDLQLHFVIAKLIDHGRKTVFGHGFSCHVCLLRPKSRGSVKLASADPAAAPLIDPNFLAEPDDLDRLMRGFKAMRNLLSQPALAALGGRELPESAAAQTDGQIAQFIRDKADTIYHPVGSCRMGTGAMDVVDPQLRVRGVQGLRVVDASIMPRIVGGNTNAPVIMIAEKAADLIRSQA